MPGGNRPHQALPHRAGGELITLQMSDKPFYQYELFADYHQIVLLDGIETALPEDVTDADIGRRLGIGPGSVVIHTARNMMVPVTVEILGHPPAPDAFAAWDHVTECDLTIRTGAVIIAGLTHIMETSPRIPLANGNYRVRTCHGNLGTISADGLDGDDSYTILLWRAPPQGVAVLKPYVSG